MKNWVERYDVDGAPSRLWYERTDGAYVWESSDHYYSNPLNPRCRLWMAFGPDQQYLFKAPITSPRCHTPRKWQSAAAAMKALDREKPL